MFKEMLQAALDAAPREVRELIAAAERAEALANKQFMEAAATLAAATAYRTALTTALVLAQPIPEPRVIAADCATPQERRTHAG